MNKDIFLRLSIKDKVLFAKRLALLVRSGIPILSSLQMLKKTAKSRSYTKIMQVLVDDVEKGQFLSVSLMRFKRIFGEFAVSIIQIGEASGTLHENLNYLAEELKKEQILKRKIRGAMVYPAFIVLATFGITILLTVFLFPKILPIFQSINFPLPWTTRVLLFVSNLLIHNTLLISGAVVALVVGFMLLLRVERIRFFVHRQIIRWPIIGQISQGYNMTNIARTLGLLLKSGVRIVEACKITARTTTNLVYRKELTVMAESITKGEKISEHLGRNSKLFPPIFTQMIAVGESTGNLSETLAYLSDMYESEVDDLIKNLSSSIEPVLMIFMGLIVGFVAISIITPIYQVTQYLHP